MKHAAPIFALAFAVSAARAAVGTAPAGASGTNAATTADTQLTTTGKTPAGDDDFGTGGDDGFGVGDDNLGNVGAIKVAHDRAVQLIRAGGDPDQVIKQIAGSMPAGDQYTIEKTLRNSLASFLKANGQTNIDPPQNGVVRSPNANLLSGLAGLDAARHPNDFTVLAGAGGDKFRLGEFREAYNDYSRAMQLGDNSPTTVLGYGASAYKLGDYTAAANAALKVLQEDPTNKEALSLYHSSKDRSPTVSLPSALGEIAAANPGPGAMPGGTPAARAPGYAPAPPPSGMTAAQVAAAARAATPGSEPAARSMQFTKDAANALRVRDFPTAYMLANQAVALNPQNAQALNFRAMSLTQMRRYSDAVQDASSGLGLAPGNAALLHTRSWAFSKQGKYREGLQDAEAASAADPTNAILYQDKAYALAGLGDREGVLSNLRRSAELDGRFANRLERAVQLPQNSDMTLLFDDGASGAAATAAAPAAPADPGARAKRFARLGLLTAIGGLLIALGTLHIVSASWRDRVRMTVRRVLGSSPASTGGAVASETGAGPGGGAFWTQYELVREIGMGGMGVVYEANDRSLERRVAVKKMRDEIRMDPQDRRRFVNEARLVAQLHHPNIVDIYGIVEDGNEVYLVFEFVAGRTLQDLLKADGAMPLGKAAGILREMAAAVSHAHAKGVIHRDLKPSNAMLTDEGRVKVMDFGVARQAKDAVSRLSMTNTVVGTPPYMAPEQEQGTVRKESDVYALGVCLYEMTTGQLPFAGAGAAMLLNKLNGKLIPPTRRVPSLPLAFDEVVAKALDPDPEKRYRTPEELSAAVDAAVAAHA